MVSWANQGNDIIRVPTLVVAIAAAVAVGIIAAIVIMHPYLALDATVERDVQSTNLGPLTLTFPFLSWLGGPGGVPMQVVVAILVLLFNRRAWLLAFAALVGGLWYLIVVNLVNRPRPTVGQILRVTEHPGSTSFPSGHLIFITISAGILMLCLGYRYLPRWAGRSVGQSWLRSCWRQLSTGSTWEPTGRATFSRACSSRSPG